MRNGFDEIELLDRDLVDLVHNVDGRGVDSVSLDDVDKFVDRRVAAEDDVRVQDLVLVQDRLDRLLVQVAQRDARADVESSPLLLAESDVGRFLVEPNAESLQLFLDFSLVRQGLEAVQHDQDQIASSGSADNLSTASLSVLGSFDDARQIQQLDFRSFVLDDAGNTRESSLEGRRFLVFFLGGEGRGGSID